jgi:hypothetical protein
MGEYGKIELWWLSVPMARLGAAKADVHMLDLYVGQ